MFNRARPNRCVPTLKVCGLLLSSLSFLGCQHHVSGQTGAFSEQFGFVRDIAILGSQDVPVFSGDFVDVAYGKVYISDYLGHHVLIFDSQGTLLHRLGRKGSGPSDFMMPAGTRVDAAGNLYVNDRGNQRVQIFNPFMELTKTVIAPGQNEVMAIRDAGVEPTIVMVGAKSCGPSECLVQEYDGNGKLVAHRAKHNEEFVLYSWVSFLDNEGNVYIANKIGNSIDVYGPQGRLRQTVDLISPSMNPFVTIRKEPRTRRELSKLVGALNKTKYTMIRGVFSYRDHIFVQLEQKNFNGVESRFEMDIYDRRGDLKFYGIETPGLMCSVGDGLYFVEMDKHAEYGGMKIRAYRFRADEAQKLPSDVDPKHTQKGQTDEEA